MKIDDLKDVFELAATTGTFINELMKIKSTSKNNYEDDAKIKKFRGLGTGSKFWE